MKLLKHNFIKGSIAVLLLVLATTFVPCKHQEPLHYEKITIGATIWPGYLLLYVARDKGFFKELGLDVEIKTYVSQAECSKDYTSGKLQGRTNLTSEMITESLAGFDQRVVMIIDYSNGSDGIVALPSITNLKQFKGKKIAFEHNTLEEYFLTYALAQSGLSLKDIIPVDLDAEASAKAIMEGNVDIAVTFEPFLSEATKNNKNNLVYSSANAPGIITDIFTFRTDFVQTHPKTITAFMQAYFKALKFWQENPNEANDIIAKEYHITREEIAQQLKGITILDENANATAFTFSVGTQSLYGNMRKVGDFIFQHQGKKEILLDTDKLIEKQFIREIIKAKAL